MRGRACGASAGRCGHFSVLLVLLLVVILSSSVPGAVGSSNAVGNVGPRKADVPGIQCQVCHRLAEHLYASRPDGAKTTEDQVIEFVEKSTTAWRPEGAWITRLHVAANEPRGVWAWYFTRLLRLLRLSPSPSPSSPPASLVLVDMRRPGQCTLACRTIEYAAQKVMGEHDADVGEALYVGRYGSVAAFRAWFCGALTGSCDAGATEGAAEGGSRVRRQRCTGCLWRGRTGTRTWSGSWGRWRIRGCAARCTRGRRPWKNIWAMLVTPSCEL